MMNRPELGARARQSVASHVAAEPKSVFVVEIGNDKFGLPIESVRSVMKVQDISPVPLAPPHFIGLMNLRGRVVAAVDLRMCLGKPQAAQAVEQLAVGVEIDGEDYALTVDNVGEVIELNFNDRIAFHAPNSRNSKVWMAGIFNTPHGVINLLSLADLLRTDSANIR